MEVPDILDALLLDFGMVQWCGMIARWQAQGKGWTTREKITEAMHWYVQGRNESRTPIFDSMCANCGSWLYGPINSTAVSNKKSGPPVTKDGEILQRDRKEAMNLQPPFLLRWNPGFFAKEAPDVFEWDARERVLRLRESHRERPPWMRLEHNRVKNTSESWLYCQGCHGHLFSTAESDQPFVAFRDSKSVDSMRCEPCTSVSA